MKFKIEPIDIDQSNPFFHDILNRKEEIEKLTALLSADCGSLVMGLDASWGTGKTTFLRMWQAHLKSLDIFSVYINAWETDYFDDPFLAIMGELNTEIEKMSNPKSARRFLKVKKSAIAMAKRIAPASIKLITSGVIDIDKIGDALAAAAEEAAKEAIENYDKAKSSVAGFKNELRTFSKSISSEEKTTPIVVFIDELDRCRPDYAIEMLERVKHLFDIEGMVFVLAIDQRQLGKTIECKFGAGMDVDGYLSRFIDFHYRLPLANNRIFFDNLVSKYRSQMEAIAIRIDLRDAVFNIDGLFSFSLRIQEQIFLRLVLTLKALSRNTGNVHAYIVYMSIFLLYLRRANKTLFDKLYKETATLIEILSYIEALPKGQVFLINTNIGEVLEGMFTYNLLEDDDQSITLGTHLTARGEKFDGLFSKNRTKETYESRIRRVISECSEKSYYWGGNLFKTIIETIEFAARFVPS